MTPAEKLELALIAIVGLSVELLAGHLPSRIGIGPLLLGASAMLLFQGLVRDLWLITRQKPNLEEEARRKALCMCAESTVGMTGVVAGLGILGSGIDAALPVSPLLLSALVSAVLVFGFLIRDFIFEWRPFRIRREKDHLNVVFSWKR